MTWRVLQRLVICIGIAFVGVSHSYAQSGELDQLKQFALQQMRTSQSAKAAYDQCLSRYGTGLENAQGWLRSGIRLRIIMHLHTLGIEKQRMLPRNNLLSHRKQETKLGHVRKMVVAIEL